MKKNIDIFFKILFITCLFVFTYFLLNIIKWDKENRKIKKLNNDIKSNTVVIEKDNWDNIIFTIKFIIISIIKKYPSGIIIRFIN